MLYKYSHQKSSSTRNKKIKNGTCAGSTQPPTHPSVLFGSMGIAVCCKWYHLLGSFKPPGYCAVGLCPASKGHLEAGAECKPGILFSTLPLLLIGPSMKTNFVVSEVRWVMQLHNDLTRYSGRVRFYTYHISFRPFYANCVLLGKKVTGLSWSKILLSLFFKDIAKDNLEQ